MPLDIVATLSRELALPRQGVAAVIQLLAEGATVPFVARYRKEATGGLDEVQIRSVQERAQYLGELEERKRSVLEEIARQGKMTDELRAQIEACLVKAELEDLYLPYKPKRRTRAMVARERGLEPLAHRILEQAPDGLPREVAAGFVDAEKGVASAEEALQGARDIAAEVIAETAVVRAYARTVFLREGVLKVRKRDEVSGPTKFETYYDFQEPVRTIPSHRFLAVRRGENEKVLEAEIVVDGEAVRANIARLMGRLRSSPWAGELETAIADAWKRLLQPSLEVEARLELKQRADEKAVDVFASNLRSLLLAPPLGAKTVIGIDPGQRTGCKLAVVDDTGKLVEHAVLYLVQGPEELERSRATLRALVAKHRPAAIAVGNGTHGRETDAFVRSELQGFDGLFSVLVNEAGASVYSASEVARGEFPDLDLTVRGAVSIARRLQDPLAELVKIDPKAIGVGQYQHDVSQALLERKLDEVVESCVNQVGVDLNTASGPLLSYVAGIGRALAYRIVKHRETHGPFASRSALLEVGGVGPKTFEQAAGFLRIRGAANPLEASGVHPERYAVVEAMAADVGVDLGVLVGNAALVARLDWQRYVSEGLGEPTLRDILAELQRPGRDPRAEFEPPKFRDDVRTLEDLKPGMELEGVVTNVTAFGAFVDLGVHQDGLVHLSQLADRFVREASEVVRPGDKIKVRVLEVDLERRRISLSAKSAAAALAAAAKGERIAQEGRDERPRDQARGRRQRGAQEGGQAQRQSEHREKGQSKPQPAPKKDVFRNNPFATLLKR